MGSGIAQAFAQRSVSVLLVDNDPAALERARILIEASLETLSAEDYIELEPAEALARIAFSDSLQGASARAVDVAIEAIVEDVAAKRKLFTQLDDICPPETILCSNSSYLNIFEAVSTRRPDKIVLAHWYAPPQLVPLVDVVGGEETSEESIGRVMELLRGIGKRPIRLKKFISGYAINRLQHAFNREAHYLIDNGYLTPEELDDSVRNGLAARMLVLGVLARMDFAGLTMATRHPPGFEEVPFDYQYRTLAKLIDEGASGVKSGRGFFDYEGRDPVELYRERDLRLIHVLRALEALDRRGPLAAERPS